MGKFSSYIEEDFLKISASSHVEKLVFRAVLVMTCQKFDVDAKIALKATFSTYEKSEILGKFSLYTVGNFPKILGSSYVEK